MVARLRRMALAIPRRSPLTRVTPALCMATSVPVPIAMPASASLNAGASPMTDIEDRTFTLGRHALLRHRLFEVVDLHGAEVIGLNGSLQGGLSFMHGFSSRNSISIGFPSCVAVHLAGGAVNARRFIRASVRHGAQHRRTLHSPPIQPSWFITKPLLLRCDWPTVVIRAIGEGSSTIQTGRHGDAARSSRPPRRSAIVSEILDVSCKHPPGCRPSLHHRALHHRLLHLGLSRIHGDSPFHHRGEDCSQRAHLLVLWRAVHLGQGPPRQ
jgi:hypothetical protein